MTDEYTLFFAPMKTVIASNQTTTTSTGVAVDMATGFTDDLLADNIHIIKQVPNLLQDAITTNSYHH